MIATVTTLKSKNARGRAAFTKLITEVWQDKQLEAVFQTGNYLETAKAELVHGEWTAMVNNDLPFGRQQAFMLITVATDDRIRDVKHALHLPTHLTTLYELTKVDDETFAAAIADGRINPRMERKDALALRPNRPRKPSKKRERSKNPNVVSACILDVQGRVNEIFDDLDQSGRDDLLTMLAHFVETLKKSRQ